MYQEKESPSDRRHLGRMLFDNFSQDDWDTYNFGFECIQTYLKHGPFTGYFRVLLKIFEIKSRRCRRTELSLLMNDGFE